jgi:hypothetical protein
MANRVLGQGAAVEGPKNTAKYNYSKKRFEFFRAFVDGYSGYLPADAVYEGEGFAWSSSGAASSEAEGSIKLKSEPQNPLTQDDPETIQSEGSKNCAFTISFESGRFYNNDKTLPIGRGQIKRKSGSFFGLGFLVQGKTLTGGGIGRIGTQVNPNNPKGQWTLEQYTSSYAKQDGKFVVIEGRPQHGGPAWIDINLRGYYFATDWTNRFDRYDHPALPPNPTTYKNQAFLIKVYKSNEVCQAAFHIIQRGNTIHWGKGGQGIWPQ